MYVCYRVATTMQGPCRPIQIEFSTDFRVIAIVTAGLYQDQGSGSYLGIALQILPAQ